MAPRRYVPRVGWAPRSRVPVLAAASPMGQLSGGMAIRC